MPGPIRVGAPTRIRHIPLSWPVEKARSNHQPKFRPVNDTVLRGREVTVGEVMEQMFAAMPSPNDWIDGTSDAAAYLQEATEVAEPFRVRIAEMLQVTFNEGALLGQDSIRADINVQLERLGSPLRLTGEDGRVTKRVAARVEEVAVEHVARNPLSRWAPIGVEAFDVVDAKSVQYAQFRSGTLVTNMVEEQQRVIRGLIGESFTVQQTFQTGRTVTGLTAQQTAHALVEVLQEVNPTSQIGQNLAKFRGVNANGLTRPWEKAVYRRAETLADRLASQGVTGVKAQMRIQKDAQRYADKLRRSRARMISRTEIKNAQVQGRLESFRQTVNDGLADPATAGKQWVTGATDVCSICSELGMSKPISLDNSFEGGFDGPTAHPNCRCDVMFVHDIASPPKAVPAGDPAYRPGTPENPITWEFPSGFKTQPSATTAFTPPGFVPPTPPPTAATTGPATASEDALEEAARVFREGGDDGTEALFDHLGFSSPPRIVEADDLARLVDESPAGEMRRVVSDLTRWDDATDGLAVIDADEVADGFRRGRDFIGDGAYGRGTYTVEGTAAEFESYVMRTIPNAADRGSVLEMTLADDARIFEFVGDSRKAGKKLLGEYAHLGFDDPHQLLAALGYDAVRYARTTESFVVVLNRGKVIVAKARGARVGSLKPFRSAGAARQTGLVSNADLVWDDAGRKWADLTSDEQLFLLDSHTDDVLRQALEEIIEAEVRLSGGATLPPLADDATLIAEGFNPAAVKAIRKQQEKVVQEIRDFTRRDVMARFADRGDFRDELFTLLDDTIDGYRIQNGGSSFGRLVPHGPDDVPVELPWSNRSIVRRPLDKHLDHIADPDSPISFHQAMSRMVGEGNDLNRQGLGPGITPRWGREITGDVTGVGWRSRWHEARMASRAELELEISKLGTMARTEAERILGPLEGHTTAESWITRTAIRADESIDDAYEAIHIHRTGASDRADAIFTDRRALKDKSTTGPSIRWPDRQGRPRPGKPPGSFGRYYGQESVRHLDDALYQATEGVMDRLVIETVSEILDDLGQPFYLDDITNQILWSQKEPIEEAIEQIAQLIDDMHSAGMIGPGTSISTEQALAFLDPTGPTGLIARTVAKIGDGSTMVTQAREVLAPVSAAMDAIEVGVSSKIITKIETFWSTTAAPEFVTLSGQIRTDMILSHIARALKDGVRPDGLLGAMSTLRPAVGRHADDAVRAAINRVMRQVREIGGDEFQVLSGGETVNFYSKTLQAMDPTRAGNERVLRTVEEMRSQSDGWMPTEWIERSNERGSVGFYNAGKDRSHYAEMSPGLGRASGDGMINAGTRSLESLGERTAFHEVTHRVQLNVPIHREMEDAYWFRRTRLPDRPAGITDDQWAEIEKLYEWRQVGSEAREIGIRDEFYNDYVGKWYDGRATGNKGHSVAGAGALEMSPMSITHLAGSGSDAGRALVTDLSSIDWILGMMLGL